MLIPLDFELLRLQHGRYVFRSEKLRQELAIHAIPVLVFAWADNADPAKHVLRHQTIVDVDGGQRGKPGGRPPEKWKTIETVPFEKAKVVQSAHATYRMKDGGIVTLDLKPVSFQITDEFNKNGDPVVNVISAIELGALARAQEKTQALS